MTIKVVSFENHELPSLHHSQKNNTVYQRVLKVSFIFINDEISVLMLLVNWGRSRLSGNQTLHTLPVSNIGSVDGNKVNVLTVNFKLSVLKEW